MLVWQTFDRWAHTQLNLNELVQSSYIGKIRQFDDVLEFEGSAYRVRMLHRISKKKKKQKKKNTTDMENMYFNFRAT